MIAGNNTLTREGFVKQLAHPRKEEMATMILDGASYEELAAKGFGRINVLEMVSMISTHVEEMAEFVLDVPADDSYTGKAQVANGAGIEEAREPGEGNQETVETAQAAAAPVETPAAPVEGAETTAPVSTETVPTPTADTPAAPVAPETPATPETPETPANPQG